MTFCPNCGSACDDGAKFCGSCGGALPAARPQLQPAEPQPRPYVQQPQIRPDVQPVQTAPESGKNGFCTAGFVLSLLGIFLFGTTTLFGLIFSVVGLISAKKKKQKGKGKAIAGIIMSLLVIICAVALILYFRTNDNPLNDIFEGTGISMTEATDDTDSDAIADLVTGEGWVLVEDGTYLKFSAKKNTVKHCMSYPDTKDNYESGNYEMYTGKKAVNYLTKKAGIYGITKEELKDIIKRNDQYDEDNLIAITCDYEKYIRDGEAQNDWEARSSHMYGFLIQIEQDGKVFDAIAMTDVDTGESFTLIMADQYPEYDAGGGIPNNPVNPTDNTDIIVITEPVGPTENTTSDDENIVGDNLTGTVTLTQGNWAVWTEADGDTMDDFIWSRHQRINIDTGTIINLTTFHIVGDPDNVSVFGESAKKAMQDEGTTVVDYGDTFIGGYKAYTVTGLYQDGMYLTVWYFVDKSNALHYISVEYYPDDYASYEMVRDTYSLD